MRLARTHSATRFWGVAYTLAVLLTGTNLATPLYRDYEARFGFSPLVLTLIFAAYVAALIPALLVVGPLSDAVGRRRVLVPAVLMAVVAAAAFAVSDSVAWLFGARVLQGVAVGAASGALTAALTELEPGGDRRRAALVSTVASVGGLGFGPLLGGLLAQYAPAPHVLPFVLEIALLVPAVVAVASLPARRGAVRWAPRRPSVPAEVRKVFVASGATSFLAFAMTGVFLSLIPAYVARLWDSGNLLLAGGTVALLLACSATAQLLAHGRPGPTLEQAGLPALALGLVLIALAGSNRSPALMLAAVVLAGAGQGLTFLAGLTAVNDGAPAERRADVLSSFYVVIYLGVGAPAIGVGLLAGSLGLFAAVQWFAAVIAGLCLVALAARVAARTGGRRRCRQTT